MSSYIVNNTFEYCLQINDIPEIINDCQTYSNNRHHYGDIVRVTILCMCVCDYIAMKMTCYSQIQEMPKHTHTLIAYATHYGIQRNIRQIKPSKKYALNVF